MAVLVPAILTREPSEVKEQFSFLESFPQITDVQIDFADGKFVPNKTVLPKELEMFDSKFRVEAHMMVFQPQNYLHDLEGLEIDSVIIHYESSRDHGRLESVLSNIKSLGMKCGLAINPNTEIGVFDMFIEQIDVAVIMSVNPGFQGQAFISETLDRIKALRQKHPDAIIEVDGGVKLENVGEVIGAEADRIVVGSGIWVTPEPKSTIKKFLSIIYK